MSDREAAIRMAEEIRDERGPNRVMEIQRARMWDREPSEWTRYERHLSEALLGTEAELAAAREQNAWHKATKQALMDAHEAAVRREEGLRQALREIEAFPISGYHAGAAQRIARAALAAGEGEKDDAVYGDWRDNPGNYGE